MERDPTASYLVPLNEFLDWRWNGCDRATGGVSDEKRGPTGRIATRDGSWLLSSIVIRVFFRLRAINGSRMDANRFGGRSSRNLVLIQHNHRCYGAQGWGNGMEKNMRARICELCRVREKGREGRKKR